ncbi:MAG TPA: ribose-5-phosphate isomerase RpiA [Stellaceae bacterium]|jgi:ribose 5-phosphate isomerase A|nr:ribose-5-phosphate isomerase RpiA [Stellaceae bacterium]
MHDRDHLKSLAAQRAVEFVENGMVLGLGTGSTAAFVVEHLAARVARGLSVVAIPTSEHTAELARHLHIPLTNFAAHHRLDLAIDGADEVQRGSLALVKGGGGALLREKIVAAASARFIVVVDQDKLVDRLGQHMPLPVEIVQFGWQATMLALQNLGAVPELRRADAGPFVTDGGNYIADCHFGMIDDPARLENLLNMTVGVVDNGLFVGRASQVIVATDIGVEILAGNERNIR